MAPWFFGLMHKVLDWEVKSSKLGAGKIYL